MLACGQTLRGDDAVAFAAVRRLPLDIRHEITVRRVGALSPEDLVALPAGARVVIVDAIVGPPPGTVLSLDLADIPAGRSGRELRFTSSSHQLPLGDVIALAQLLRVAPLTGSFVGLAIESVAMGATLSDPVRAALPDFREAVADAIRAAR